MRSKIDIPNVDSLVVPEFRDMLHAIHEVFGSNLRTVFVHGSLFYDKLYSYSDYDVVIVVDKLSPDVLERDIYANKLKRMLRGKWGKNPFSFDLFTLKELKVSAKEGHPFVRSILYEGFPIYDVSGLFVRMRAAMAVQISKKMQNRMYKNFVFLSKKHYEISKVLLNANEVQFAIREISSAITLLMRAFLIQEKVDMYKGEIYQYFVRRFPRLDHATLNLIWRYGLHGNQMSSRLVEPHVDIPLQEIEGIYNSMAKLDMVSGLFKLYEKLSKSLPR